MFLSDMIDIIIFIDRKQQILLLYSYNNCLFIQTIKHYRTSIMYPIGLCMLGLIIFFVLPYKNNILLEHLKTMILSEIKCGLIYYRTGTCFAYNILFLVIKNPTIFPI